jgi:hypothetical protein
LDTYRTFLRSARDFEEFARARKVPQESGLSEAEARERCREFNARRSRAQIKAGTKMEFERE